VQKRVGVLLPLKVVNNINMEKKLRVGIIGGGMFFDDIIGQSFKDFERGGFAGFLTSIGMSHFAPLVADIKIETVAIGTRSAKSATAGRISEDFLKTFPLSAIKPYYGEGCYREIVDREKPDILVVATPDHFHTEPILYALGKGLHVITEKPLCLKTEEADRIIETARQKNLVVAVDMHKRYDPAVRDMLSSCAGKYGKINRVRAALEEPLALPAGVFKWAEHSNPFSYVGCHWLDAVAFYLDVFPLSLYATGEKNLLANWDSYVKKVAGLEKRDISEFPVQRALNCWDGLNVNITYDNGMRGDFNNNWINPAEFEGASNQEIEVYGILGRGFVDQQDRGYRETVIGDGSRTRNPFFGGHIRNKQGYEELFGYGKASIVAGLLAVSRVKFLGENASDIAGSYPDAASQRSITMIIEAAEVVAEKNFNYFCAEKRCPVTASFSENEIVIVDPLANPSDCILYRRHP